MRQLSLADRGQTISLDKSTDETTPICLSVARLGSVQTAGSCFTVWIQVRGSTWVEAKEGRFRLRRGEWIAFEKESRPLVQAGRSGLCVGLALNADALRMLMELADCGLYAGRGQMSLNELRIALRLWRDALDSGLPAQALRPMLLHLASLQRTMAGTVQRCPGRSRSRKRQVFGRMQRARLYLEGNSHRVVRIGELAELTNFSSWYLSKTFQSLYEESPQALSARLRLERAADLLRDTDMMIGEVAAASGFDNCCSFARAFRARFGTSASHYRESAAKLSPHSAKSLAASRKPRTATQS